MVILRLYNSSYCCIISDFKITKSFSANRNCRFCAIKTLLLLVISKIWHNALFSILVYSISNVLFYITLLVFVLIKVQRMHKTWINGIKCNLWIYFMNLFSVIYITDWFSDIYETSFLGVPSLWRKYYSFYHHSVAVARRE